MRWLVRTLLAVFVAFCVAQVVPYGRDHDNPRSVREPRWDSPRTRSLAASACLDCHSNVTDWQWYTKVAPISWLVARDVKNGRAALNFSEWQRPQEANLQDVLETIRENGMPPIQYRVLHEEARLSADEKNALERGLIKTWSASPPGG